MRDFSILMSAFGIGFGICLEANLTHGEEVSTKLSAVLSIAFWPLFGEIEGVLENMNNQTCNGTNELTCLGSISYVSTYVLLMFYMVIGTILLINLLIAIFRYFPIIESFKYISNFYHIIK
jgi:hypothetical protein